MSVRFLPPGLFDFAQSALLVALDRRSLRVFGFARDRVEELDVARNRLERPRQRARDHDLDARLLPLRSNMVTPPGLEHNFKTEGVSYWRFSTQRLRDQLELTYPGLKLQAA
jgi:hypothetical protein